jgi:N-acetyl-anhydromuramyl-L-alanine amidase AmpD
MVDARTKKVLAVLLVSMTVGALLLMAMESEPPRADRDSLAMASGGRLQPNWTISHPWKRIVVHASTGGADTLPRRCHFVVTGQPMSNGRSVRPTNLWKQQTPGYHIYVPGHDFNADSIGICLMGDFSTTPPTPQQFQALVNLIRQLQKKSHIPNDNVYLHSELVPEKDLPGKAFPLGAFKDALQTQKSR